MSKKICLTKKQELCLNVIKTFHKENGTFPNQRQFIDGIRAAGGKAGNGTVIHMYGTLLLKGAFTGGTTLSDNAYSRHSGGNIDALDISKLTFAPKTIKRGRGAAPKAKADPIAATLLALLQGDDRFKALLANITQISG
jgi:hypothetical protein